MNEDIKQLRALKSELITEINKVANDFIKTKNLVPLAAFNDANVQKIVKDLDNLTERLSAFLDALENYIRYDGLKLDALEKMLEELEGLQKAIIKIAEADYGNNDYIKLIRAKVNVLVGDERSGLLQTGEGLIDKILKIVPKKVIANLLYLLQWVNKIPSGLATVASALNKDVNIIGGKKILEILGRLKFSNNETLLQAMLAPKLKNPLQPIRDFLAQALRKLRKEDVTTPSFSSQTQMAFKTKDVQDAKVKLIDGFDQQVKDLITKSENIIGLGADDTVKGKIKELNILKEKLNAFLQAIDNFLNLPFYALGIKELSEVIKALAELQTVIDALKPAVGDMTIAAAEVQDGINTFIDKLISNKSLDNLIIALNGSTILSAAVEFMKSYGAAAINFVKNNHGFLENLGKLLDVDLNLLVTNLESTGLSNHIQRNPTESFFNIFNGFINNMLNVLKRDVVTRIDAVTLTQLIANTEDQLSEMLKNLDEELDKSANANQIREETIILVLVNNTQILPKVNRGSYTAENVNNNYKTKIDALLQSADWSSNVVAGVKNILFSIYDRARNILSSSKVTSAYHGGLKVKKKTEEVHSHVIAKKPSSSS
ncbi:MAG: hypothetical protein ABSF18_03790 [Gammaproteobacteria bacterium]|jgi:sugar-specific transcriptional regulator TrmB